MNGVEQVERPRPGDPAAIGPYRLLGRLGAGGMGEVFLGRDRGGRLAAVKVVHPGLAGDPQFRVRFAREVATARAIRAPWAVEVIDADPNAPTPWLATEYIAGPSLAQTGPLPEDAVAGLAARLAAALAELHVLGVVHRDLKPSNVLLAADTPRLIDFGIARAVDATMITQTGLVLGTPSYMSPEQALGEPTGPESDVFSLASVLVHAATGASPFGATTTPVAMLRRIADVDPDLRGVPDALRAVLLPCLAKDPAQRPTAARLARDLAGHATTPWPPPSVAALLPTPEPERREPAPRPTGLLNRRTLLVGLGGLGVLGAAGVGVASWAERAGGRPAPPTNRGGVVRWSMQPPGVLYHLVVSDGGLYAGGDDKRVYALDPATGRARWTFDTSSTVGALVVAGGLCCTQDFDGLHALEAASGRLRWSHAYADVVAVAADVVVANIPNEIFTGRLLIGLDATAGAIRWRYSDQPQDLASVAKPVAADGRVHIAFTNRLTTLDAHTGAVLWEHPWSGSVTAMVVTAGRVYVLVQQSVTALEHNLIAFDAASGAVNWQTDAGPSSLWLTIDDRTVYSGFGSRISAWDLVTGGAHWTINRDEPDLRNGMISTVGTPAVLGDALFSFDDRKTDDNGRLDSHYGVSALATADGTARWSVHLDELNTTYQVGSTNTATAEGPPAVCASDAVVVVATTRVNGKATRSKIYAVADA